MRHTYWAKRPSFSVELSVEIEYRTIEIWMESKTRVIT